MLKISKITTSFVILVIAAESLWAGCVYPPAWRTKDCKGNPSGKPPTTYQRWDFTNSANPALPSDVHNSYQTPYKQVQANIVGDPLETWGWYSSYNGRSGVWHGNNLEMTLQIPNRYIDPRTPCYSTTYKEIYLEMIYQGIPREPTIAALPENTVERICQTIITEQDGWKRLIQCWRVRPNPYEEFICVGLGGTGGSIDRITVDTKCIPEPATILLLTLGGVMTALKKRRA